MPIPKLVVQHPPISKLPRGLLLDNISELPLPPALNGDAPNDSDHLRWLDGVTWEPTSCDPLQIGGVAACDNDATLVDAERECESAVTQEAFVIYDALRGSTLETEIELIDERLTERLTYMTSYSFARELLTAFGSTGLSLANQAHAPQTQAFTDAAVSVRRALALLTEDLGNTLRGGRGIIHMGPAAFGEAVDTGSLLWVDGQWQTPIGHVVVADAGYHNAPPPTGGTAATLGTQEWIYASGPVMYRMSDPDLLGANGSERIDRARNTLHRWLTMYGILVFDPCPVTAVRATVG